MGKGGPRARDEGWDQRGKQGQITQGVVASSGLAGLSPEGNREFLETSGKARLGGYGEGQAA